MTVRYTDFAVSAALVRKNLISPTFVGLNNTTPNAWSFSSHHKLVYPRFQSTTNMFIASLLHHMVLGRSNPR